LQSKTELAEKYGIDPQSLDFSMDDFTEEELTQKFEAMRAADGSADGEAQAEEPAAEQDAVPAAEQQYALTGNLLEELIGALDAVTVQREWGECRRYCYVDCDFDAMEVYCWDVTDWKLYGFPFQMNGDACQIDFENKKRKKYVIADFDEGEQIAPTAALFAQMEQRILDGAQWEAKYQAASDAMATMGTELDELRKFKEDVELQALNQARADVFARFEDLVGVDAFEALRNDCSAYDAEALEEKCYAIRGRNAVPAKFSAEDRAPKLKVEKETHSYEPYGGIFAEYGMESN